MFKWITFVLLLNRGRIFKRAWSANFKMVWSVLLRPLRPELDGQDQVQTIVTQALNCSH
jgi:hypothetical protein